MRVLVTGGAGYIGSAVVEKLVAVGDEVVVLDDLSTGHREAVIYGASLVIGDAGDPALVSQLCRKVRIEGVVHMAARSVVGDSVRDPALYYASNVGVALRLVEAARIGGVQHVVFSSTAAVYGAPQYHYAIDERHATAPLNPYGETKLAIERALHWYARAYPFSYVALRYFNAIGATQRCGERHDPETHLVPLILRAATAGDPVRIYGTDYGTPDGTCVRDYIHVADLANAHVAALGYLARGGDSDVFNLGGGKGRSVREVVSAAARIVGKPIITIDEPRRAGDPPVLVADAARARARLAWYPERTLEDGITDAWAWEQRTR